MLYHIILMFAVVSCAKAQCPIKCSCTQVPRYAENSELSIFTSVKCSGQVNTTELFPNNTREIIIKDADVDLEAFLEESQFWGSLPKLNRVEFIGCNFGSVEDVTFDQDGVTSLKFSKSNLTDLVCFNSTTLLNLELSQNELSSLKNSFRTLNNLEVLNLSANHLSLVEKSFSGLANLKSLDLSYNHLKQLSDKIFLPLINLQYLNISKNHLKILNEAWFGSLVRLQQLDVSQNQLEKVVPGNLELPSLTRLFLAGNPSLGRSKPPTLLVGMGSRLQTVDASNTGLEKVPSALTRSIRTLKLSENSIHTINCGDLDYYPLLQILDFTSNKLRTIDDDALGRLDSLAILYLSKNSMSSIPRSLPERLEILHLNRNNIKSIQASDLQDLKRLELLNLSDNNITTIEDNSFNHLLSLSSLDLSRNPLSIPAGLLTIPGKLQSLKLSGIPSLLPAKDATFPLTTPEYLITLDLSRSAGLAHQFLADTAALAASRELQELDLSETGLEYIRSDLLHYLPQLRVLHLRGNPLNCTDLQWLAYWMRKQGEYENREVTCVYPAELWGTALVDLQGLELAESSAGVVDQHNGTLGTTRPPFTLLGLLLTNIIQNYGINATTSSPPSIDFEETNSTSTDNDDIEITTITPDEVDNNDNKIIINITKNIEFFEISNVTIATSHYYSEKSNSSLAHPGMLILILGVLLTTAILTVLTKQFSKKRRRLSRQAMADIEVSSIPSVTELW